mmetsp:Transcript_1550/g.2635  ORF Transcript_1550/g.2635 Transcript_1550/m.2635 type:complete len:450 (-) Transcript_1550:11-1360(-)
MVSFENGRFILRRRQQPSAQIRLHRLFPKAKVAIIAAILFLWVHLVRRSSKASVDHDMLRAARDADIPTVVEGGEREERLNNVEQPPSSHVLHTFEVDDVQHDGGDGRENYSETGVSADKQEGDENESDKDESSGEDELSDPVREGEAKQYSIKLNNEFLEHLQSLDPIPKNVHMFFPDKEYYRKQPILSFVSHSIISLINLNPDWNVTVYDDSMIDRVIQNAGDIDIISKEEMDVLIGVEGEDGGQKQTAHIVERSDIARLLLMYQQGGIYLDVDRLVSKKFDDFITQSTRLCLPTHFDVNFAQDIMCSSSGNELFLSIIQRASKIRMESERRNGWTKGSSLYEMGPPLYNSQILMSVFGMEDPEAYDRLSGDEEFFALARGAIAASQGTIITKLESDYCNNTLVLDDSFLVCPPREELYERYGMSPWAEEVDALWESEPNLKQQHEA